MGLHFTKKDFKVDWFSGTGSGGQYRNKHQNCCRITHVESGLRAQETGNRERPANLRSAFNKLARLLVEHYTPKDSGPDISTDVVRNYNESRNEVHDKASGLKRPFTDIVKSGDLSEMIHARMEAMVVDKQAQELSG